MYKLNFFDTGLPYSSDLEKNYRKLIDEPYYEYFKIPNEIKDLYKRVNYINDYIKFKSLKLNETNEEVNIILLTEPMIKIQKIKIILLNKINKIEESTKILIKDLNKFKSKYDLELDIQIKNKLNKYFTKINILEFSFKNIKCKVILDILYPSKKIPLFIFYFDETNIDLTYKLELVINKYKLYKYDYIKIIDIYSIVFNTIKIADIL